jgi:hypothetical protein
VQAGGARIREHSEHVELRLLGIEIPLVRIIHVKKLTLIPDRLPLRLDLIEWIRFAAFAHEKTSDVNHEWTRINTNSQSSL